MAIKKTLIWPEGVYKRMYQHWMKEYTSQTKKKKKKKNKQQLEKPLSQDEYIKKVLADTKANYAKYNGKRREDS